MGAVILIATVFLCYRCRTKGKITQGERRDDMAMPRGHDPSMHLEDMDEEDYKDPNDTNRPSLPKHAGFDADSVTMQKGTNYKQVSAASVVSNKEGDGTDDPRD